MRIPGHTIPTIALGGDARKDFNHIFFYADKGHDGVIRLDPNLDIPKPDAAAAAIAYAEKNPDETVELLLHFVPVPVMKDDRPEILLARWEQCYANPLLPVVELPATTEPAIEAEKPGQAK